jgi:hypothetical protein
MIPAMTLGLKDMATPWLGWALLAGHGTIATNKPAAALASLFCVWGSAGNRNGGDENS